MKAVVAVPCAIEGCFEDLELDTIVAAIGQKVICSDVPQLEATKWNTLLADPDTFTTSVDSVFAIGDAVNDGPGIAISSYRSWQKSCRCY